ncbi:MAG: hypothetical protein ACE5FI_08330 [Anaerolineales bacterium]
MNETKHPKTAANCAGASTDADDAAPRDPLFSDLFNVSHQLRDAFAPVQPPERFVARLRDQLDANVENARRARESYFMRRKRLRWTAFGIGGAVYAAGLVVVLVRAARWLSSRRHAAPPE